MNNNGQHYHIGHFTGTTDDKITPRRFVKDFELYLLSTGTFENDALAARLFKTRLDDEAEAWFDTLPDDIKNSWTKLQKAFVDRFESGAGIQGANEARYARFMEHLSPSIDFIRDKTVWDEWLSKLRVLGREVPSDFVPKTALAFAAWHSLPTELQAIIAQPKTSISDFVENIRCIPWKSFERVLTDYDQRKELSKQLRQGQQRENEERRLRSELADMRKTITALTSRQMLPPSPPMERGHFLPSPARPAPRQLMPPSPPKETVPIVEIGQLVFEDTAEGRKRYEEAKQRYARQHPFVTTQPPVEEPYPLTPGTMPAGSNECHRCGKGYHLSREARA